MEPPGFFDAEEWLARLSGFGDPNAGHSFRRAGGISDHRPPVFYALSWSGPIGQGTRCKTIWLFRERLTQASATGRLFESFNGTLRNAGYLPISGQILNATLVAAPKQINGSRHPVFCYKSYISIDGKF